MSLKSSVRLTLLVLVASAAACERESGPAGPARFVAPTSAASFGDGLPETCGLGGYFTRVFVDPSTTLAGDGWHFTRITDAIIAARSGRIARSEKTVTTAACRITIEVAPGTYTGSFTASAVQEVLPLVLDVPRVTLEGGLRMVLDSNGRATGAAVNESDVTILRPNAPLGATQALIVVTDSANGLWGDGVNDAHGDSVTVRGFELRSGYSAPDPTSGGSGFGIFAMRVQGLIVDENRFGFLLTNAVDARGSSGRVAHNSAIDLGNASCIICLGGPGTYSVAGNTVMRSGLVGVYVIPGTSGAQPPSPTGVRPLTLSSAPVAAATIDSNYLSGAQRHPAGAAIRVNSVGQGISNLAGQRTSATVRWNDIADNRFGIIADAGFPGSPTASATIPSGNVMLTLGGNHFMKSCQANLLVSFARHTRGLGLPTPNNAAYLRQSTYDVTLGGDLAWSDVWFSHPPVDGGVTLNNTLLVNGAPVPNGALNAYHGTECGFRPSASAWIGLKNSDDVGTKFDLLTEIRRNGILVAVGQLNGVNGGSSGFNNAIERATATAVTGALGVRTGDTLSVTISARIAEGVAGHTSGTARLWLGNATANSRIVTLADTLSKTLYLMPDSTLSDTPGTGSARFLDVLVRKTGGNPFKPFATWVRRF